jgi:hypothetical protein
MDRAHVRELTLQQYFELPIACVVLRPDTRFLPPFYLYTSDYPQPTSPFGPIAKMVEQ